MTVSDTNARGVNVVYRDRTDILFRDYQGVAEQWEKRAYFISQNYDLASLLYDEDDDRLYNLRDCGRAMAGNAIPYLQPTYYCRDRYCYICGELYANRRKDRVVECCRLFAAAIDTEQLQMYRFVLHTDAPEQNPLRKLKYEYELLKAFTASINRWALNVNRPLYQRIKNREVPCNRAEKQKYIGPVVCAIHINPAHDQAPSAAVPNTHLHINIIVYPSAGKKRILEKLNPLWTSVARRQFPQAYKRFEPVLTETDTRVVSRSLNRTGELGYQRFNPFEIQDKGLTTSRLNYVARHTKHDEDMAWKLWHRRWLDKAGLLNERLYRSFPKSGPMSVKLKQIPCSFEGLASDKKYIAEGHDKECSWQLFERMTEG